MLHNETIFVEMDDLSPKERRRIFAILGALLGILIYLGLRPPGWLQGIELWINERAVWPNLPVWIYILITFIDTHITTMDVTLYLHRCETHGSIIFNRFMRYFWQVWLWLRTSMPVVEWVAVHRKHHAHVETEEDPHSPVVYGIWRVIFLGTKLYHASAHDKATLEQYGKGTPNHWVARNVYSRLSIIGPTITLISNLWLFGTRGFPMWIFEMVWIPFFAAGVINGLGHWWGSRNFDTPDNSRNLPGNIWAIITCGESWHNNHHRYQNSPKFSQKSGEIDPGWYYYLAFRFLGLAGPGIRAVHT